jgi:hypothetical protein
MQRHPPYVLIATPTYAGLATTGYVTSLLTFQTTCAAQGIGLGIRFFTDSLVTRARNELVRIFLKHEHATHLMFVDADIAFSPDQVLRLLQFDVDVAAGAYPLKQFDWAKAERAIKAGRPDVKSASLHYVLAWEDPHMCSRGRTPIRSNQNRVSPASSAQAQASC